VVDNRLPLTQAAGGRNSRHIRALGCPSKNLVWKKGIDETMREGDGTTGRGTELADDHVQRERIARAVVARPARVPRGPSLFANCTAAFATPRRACDLLVAPRPAA